MDRTFSMQDSLRGDNSNESMKRSIYVCVCVYKIFNRIGIWKTRNPTEIQRDFLCKSVRSFDTFRFNIESFDQWASSPRETFHWLSSKKKKINIRNASSSCFLSKFSGITHEEVGIPSISLKDRFFTSFIIFFSFR